MKSSRQTQPTASVKDDPGWRQFPQFEAMLGSEAPPPVLAKIEKTCRQLDEILHSGLDDDKQRAQRAMTAYGRSLDLLRALTQMRDKAAIATSASKAR